MPIDLKQLLDPAHSAVLVMECQEGIVGGGAALGALGEAVQRHGTIAQIARVLAAARAARVPIFYLTVGAPRRLRRRARPTACCSRSAARASRCCRARSGTRSSTRWRRARATIVLTRFHGVTPFHATELDQLLRNLGVRTVVATGVSVNIGITGLTIEAVNAAIRSSSRARR